MFTAIHIKKEQYALNLQGRVRQIANFIEDFKEKYKPLLLKSACIYMIVKTGLIFLATFSAVAFLTIHIAPYIALEMSRTRALLFVMPLLCIIGLKLYFILSVLMAHHQSRAMIGSVVNTIVIRGRRGIKQVEKAFQSDIGYTLPVTGKD